jgi:hypothetical protein
LSLIRKACPATEVASSLQAVAVHLGKCEHLHGAVLQVLLALRPRVAAPPPDPPLANVLARA